MKKQGLSILVVSTFLFLNACQTAKVDSDANSPEKQLLQPVPLTLANLAGAPGKKSGKSKNEAVVVARALAVKTQVALPEVRAEMANFDRVTSEKEDSTPTYGPQLIIANSKVLDLKQEFAGFEWTHLVGGPFIVGALDYTVEGLAWEIPILVSDGSRLNWTRYFFKKPHFSAWVELMKPVAISGVNGASENVIFLRLGISSGVVSDLKVTSSDKKTATDYIDYQLKLIPSAKWELLTEPQTFSWVHKAISQSNRSATLEKLKLQKSK